MIGSWNARRLLQASNHLKITRAGPSRRTVPFFYRKAKTLEVFPIYIYPDNLKAKAKLWLWELRDVAVIGAGLLLSVLALSHGAGMLLLVLTVLYAFLSIRMEGASILDFLRCAVCFLFLHQQYYEWEEF